ncbi:MAG: nucleotide exchange factor GrpE [Ignavibacteria bacterium]|nr:nucleotide exchange factor GrpE [Ignavibacteria bacterium]
MTKHNHKQKEMPEKKENKKPESGLAETDYLKEELSKTKESLLRLAAEFDNYKKRTENEISNYLKYASENLVKELLPVLDDMNRSVESIEKGETKDFETLKTGIISIANKFNKILESQGLKEIDVLGKEFNVDTCDALLQIPTPDVPPHTVVEVVEKGYYLKDKIIRHSKVLVSSKTENDDQIKDSNDQA